MFFGEGGIPPAKLAAQPDISRKKREPIYHPRASNICIHKLRMQATKTGCCIYEEKTARRAAGRPAAFVRVPVQRRRGRRRAAAFARERRRRGDGDPLSHRRTAAKRQPRRGGRERRFRPAKALAGAELPGRRGRRHLRRGHAGGAGGLPGAQRPAGDGHARRGDAGGAGQRHGRAHAHAGANAACQGRQRRRRARGAGGFARLRIHDRIGGRRFRQADRRGAEAVPAVPLRGRGAGVLHHAGADGRADGDAYPFPHAGTRSDAAALAGRGRSGRSFRQRRRSPPPRPTRRTA